VTNIKCTHSLKIKWRSENSHHLDFGKSNSISRYRLIKHNKRETNPKVIIYHLNEIIQENFSNLEKIFIDASKSTHGIGIGFVVIQRETTFQHKLYPEISIFSTENYAIHEATIYQLIRLYDRLK